MGGNWSSEYDPRAPVDLRHFKLGRSIGRGAFGKVKVVVKRDTKKLYALKYINKDACIKKRAYRNIFRERNLLEALEHPFIVNLRYAFQDDENMFMVLDLMLGGDMRFHLNRMGKFTERMAVFYAAELASALMYLHDARILHRDIKPDNILLDADGHVHLTDFNCATVMEPGKKVTSETGTAGYMAPEVYGGGGYNEAVDWWSLGVVLWECLHGERPFYGSRMDKLIWRVKHAPLRFSDEMSRRMRALLEGLLERDPARRLGASGAGHADVLSHPAFRRLDFSLLLEKQIEPPYVPDTTTLNFEPRYELEELLLEENPLHAKPRKVRGADAAPLSRELRLMDAEFMPFDYAKRTSVSGLGGVVITPRPMRSVSADVPAESAPPIQQRGLPMRFAGGTGIGAIPYGGSAGAGVAAFSPSLGALSAPERRFGASTPPSITSSQKMPVAPVKFTARAPPRDPLPMVPLSSSVASGTPAMAAATSAAIGPSPAAGRYMTAADAAAAATAGSVKRLRGAAAMPLHPAAAVPDSATDRGYESESELVVERRRQTRASILLDTAAHRSAAMPNGPPSAPLTRQPTDPMYGDSPLAAPPRGLSPVPPSPTPPFESDVGGGASRTGAPPASVGSGRRYDRGAMGAGGALESPVGSFADGSLAPTTVRTPSPAPPRSHSSSPRGPLLGPSSTPVPPRPLAAAPAPPSGALPPLPPPSPRPPTATTTLAPVAPVIGGAGIGAPKSPDHLRMQFDQLLTQLAIAAEEK